MEVRPISLLSMIGGNPRALLDVWECLTWCWICGFATCRPFCYHQEWVACARPLSAFNSCLIGLVASNQTMCKIVKLHNWYLHWLQYIPLAWFHRLNITLVWTLTTLSHPCDREGKWGSDEAVAEGGWGGLRGREGRAHFEWSLTPHLYVYCCKHCVGIYGKH